MYKPKKFTYHLITWLVISAQILALVGTATVGAVQPTPQMAQAVAQAAGFGAWIAQHTADLVAWAQPLWGAPASAQAATTYGTPVALLSTTHSATITTGRTGLCTILNCFITNSANVVDANTTNVGNINIPLGLLGGVYFSVDTNTIFPPGYRAGFLIDNGGGLIDLSLFSSFSLTTYLGGVQQESVSSAALLDVSLFGGPNSNAVSFVTSKAFDEVRLTAGSLIGALLNLDVFYAFVQPPTYSPAPGGVGSGLVFWTKAGANAYTNAGTTLAIDGQTVQQWNNQTGSGYNVTQATAGSRPTFYSTTAANLLNFNPSLSVAGAQELANTTRLHANTAGYRAFVVTKDKRTNVAEVRGPMGLGTVGNYPSFDLQTDGVSPNGWNPVMGGSSPFELGGGTFDSTALLYNGNAGGTNQQPQIFSLGSTNLAGGGLSSNNIVSTLDGFSENTDMDSYQDANIGNSIYIGSSADAQWIGLIGENIVFDRELSATELDRVNSYLAIKYGITLDANPTSATQNFDYVLSDGTTLVWPGTSNAAYQAYRFDVAGIGRDDGSALDQRKSSSVNTGIQPIIDNGAAFGADKSFLMWGGDSGANNLATTYTPNGFTPSAGYFRTTRIWKVTETGTVGNVTVSVANGSADHLLVDNDGNFTDGNTQEIAFVSGSATVNFSNGQFFALGANIYAPGGVAGGLETWVKADAGAGSSDGAAVATWTDQSLSGYDFAQATAGSQPTYYSTTADKLLNFNPVVDFDGTGDYLRNTGVLMPSASPYTFLAVGVDEDAGTGYRKIFGSEAIVDYFGLYKQGGATNDNGWIPYAVGGQARSAPFIGDRGSMGKGTKYSATGGANGYWNGTNFTSDSRTEYAQPQIVGFNSLNSATTDPFYTWTDGYKEDPNWSPIVDGLVFRNQFFSQTSIGADVTVELWKGRIPEFMAYSQSLADSDIAKINSYLAIKYGITLGQGNGHVGKNGNNYNYVDTSGAVIWDGTANSTYAYNIAGIGRDDAEALNQKQAKSIQTGFQPTIGLGTIAATNAANTGSFGANKSYLIWGDNGQAASFNTAYTPDSFSATTPYYRMDRIWKAQESGTVGTVQVSVSGGAEYMVVDTDGDGNFATGTQAEIALSGGSFAYNFANGNYFTFITAQVAPGGVTGYDFWVKANDAGCLVDATCAAWQDHSGNDNAIEATGVMILQPADSAHNYNPYFGDFNSSNHFWDATSSLNNSNSATQVATDLAVFAGVRPNSATATGRIIGIDNDTLFAAEPGYSLNAGKPYFYKFSGGAQSHIYATAAPANQSSLVGWNFSNTNTDLDISLNGLNQTFGTASGSGIVGQNLRIGYGTWDLSAAFPGDIMEVVWYKTSLTSAQRQRVEAYLALKYGVTLDRTDNNATIVEGDYLASDGTTKFWDSAANSIYHNDVAGIGRDDGSALDQRKSQSVNGDDPIIMDNSGTFSANQQFLVWGNNNGAVSLTANYSGGTNNRLARVWKVQKTGTVAAVKVTLPRAAVTNAGLRSLIVHASDANFGTVDRTYPLTSRGGNYEVTVNFNNGDYFTFSTSSTLPEINVTPATIDFGTVNTGSTSSAQAVTVQNLGDVSLNLSSISLSGADAGQFAISSNNCGATLNAGASCTVQLTFTPTTVSDKNALLVINNNDADEGTVNVVLSGTTPSASGGGMLNQYNLAVTKSASVATATPSTPFNYTITVYNKGTVAASNVVATNQLPAGVTFNSATPTGGGNCNHASGIVTCTWASLASGASATVTISVTP